MWLNSSVFKRGHSEQIAEVTWAFYIKYIPTQSAVTVWLEKSLAFNAGKNNPTQKVQFRNLQKTRTHPENRIRIVDSSATVQTGFTRQHRRKARQMQRDRQGCQMLPNHLPQYQHTVGSASQTKAVRQNQNLSKKVFNHRIHSKTSRKINIPPPRLAILLSAV